MIAIHSPVRPVKNLADWKGFWMEDSGIRPWNDLMKGRLPCFAQGIAAARKAWRAKNAPPALTKNEVKAARPTGRGDGRGPGRNPGGRGGSAPARGGPGR